IKQLIKAKDLLTFEQIRDITQDIGTNDPNADYLKPLLLDAIERAGAANRDERINKAANYLRAWDNHAVDGSVAKTIFDAWLQAAREGIFGEFKGLDSVGAISGARNLFNTLMQPSLILHALGSANSELQLSRDYLNGKDRNEVMVSALS